jgi:hypothetical protein
MPAGIRISRRRFQILTSPGAIRDPFEQSLFAAVHLPYLRSFHDANRGSGLPAG